MRMMLQNNTQQSSLMGTSRNVSSATKNVDPIVAQRTIRKKRSSQYMEAMSALDIGGCVSNRQQVEKLLDDINAEFDELDMQVTELMLGVVAKCYLGDPYDVHILDPTGRIIQHYKKGEILPGHLEKARSLAARGGYAFVEVYAGYCAAVSKNGSVSIVQG